MQKIDRDKKTIFYGDLIEKLYSDFLNNEIKDNKSIDYIFNKVNNRKILIIAPGGSVNNEKNKIDKFISDNNPIVVSINYYNENLKTDFIFINRFGQPQHQATLNKAIRRIIRNCNDKQFLESENPEVLLPHFSCHSLRHTFTTRMCEAGVNVKVIQDALGHKDVSTTLNIYTDVTKELRKSEFEGLELQFNQ